MSHKCLVVYCNSDSLKNADLTFHRIPYDRRSDWLEACKRTDLINKSQNYLNRKYVCSKHFEKNMYKKTSLKKSATPILYLSPTVQNSSTQTYDSIKFFNPAPSIRELPSKLDHKNFEIGKSHTDTEKFICYTSHNKNKKQSDNPDTQIEVQSDRIELKCGVKLGTNKILQMSTDSDQESVEDTTEMSNDEFLQNNFGLEEEITKEIKEENIQQISINKSNPRANLFEIDKEIQTDDVAVFDIPKNNVCFQQCLRCGKNASRIAPKKLKPLRLITLDDFKRACEQFLSPTFCSIVHNQIRLENLLKENAIKNLKNNSDSLVLPDVHTPDH